MNEILDLPQAIEQRRLPYAGFWIRVGAYLVDGILLGIVNFAIAKAFISDYSFMEPNLAATGINSVLGIAYFVLMESSEKQATLGKMLLNLKVGKANGERLSVANALGRYFAKIISALILCIGFMMVGWDDKKQGLHDKIANTYVFEA
jgi:uncharacterized RDD family membrane protein YckC